MDSINGWIQLIQLNQRSQSQRSSTYAIRWMAYVAFLQSNVAFSQAFSHKLKSNKMLPFKDHQKQNNLVSLPKFEIEANGYTYQLTTTNTANYF